MTHYVCEGECGGTAQEPGQVCHSENCSAKGKEFAECNCTDGKHGKEKKE